MLLQEAMTASFYKAQKPIERYEIMKRRTHTVLEFAEIMGIGKNQAYQAIRENRIPHLRIGKRILIPDNVIENLLRCEEEEAGEAA